MHDEQEVLTDKALIVAILNHQRRLYREMADIQHALSNAYLSITLLAAAMLAYILIDLAA